MRKMQLLQKDVFPLFAFAQRIWCKLNPACLQLLLHLELLGLQRLLLEWN